MALMLFIAENNTYLTRDSIGNHKISRGLDNLLSGNLRKGQEQKGGTRPKYFPNSAFLSFESKKRKLSKWGRGGTMQGLE